MRRWVAMVLCASCAGAPSARGDLAEAPRARSASGEASVVAAEEERATDDPTRVRTRLRGGDATAVLSLERAPASALAVRFELTIEPPSADCATVRWAHRDGAAEQTGQRRTDGAIYGVLSSLRSLGAASVLSACGHDFVIDAQSEWRLREALGLGAVATP